jgi:hypothetical protein
MNTLTEAERRAGWRLLFDGRSLDQWRGYRMAAMPAGWRVEDGAMVKDGEQEDIVSRAEYGDFELAWEWKLTPGGNAGLFYRATEAGNKIYVTGPEYQLLDDARHPDGKSALTSTAAAYGLYAAPRGVVRPAGAWNQSRLVVDGARVEHWLNGRKVVEYTLGSPDWEAKVRASKFDEWKGYGRATRGVVGFQGDHTGTLSLRDLKVRPLR